MVQRGYLALNASGALRERVAAARALMDGCRLCPRECGARRLGGELGACGVGDAAIVSSYGPHFGEEMPLVGRGGSGTIFFARCNLHCVYCQNADISQRGDGEVVSAARLARMMLELQRLGCHNINVVTPTHQVFQVPLVYNCGGYESVETLRLLDGIVDIYMPDFKYTDAETARRYSGVDDYPDRAEAAIREMHRQVGDLMLDGRGIAQRGLLVRHLVLPDGLAGTVQVAEFLATLSRNTYVNIMGQYRPCHLAGEHPPLNRRPSAAEMTQAIHAARAAGLRRLDGRV
jgi:putative pyruvate formate lyase activating enzyme